MAPATKLPGERIPMPWDEYELLGPEARGEYIDGELVVSPSPSGRHQDVSLNLALMLKGGLTAPAMVREGWAWKPHDDEFVPDLIVFDAVDEQSRFTGIPHLVVEILSSDPARDIIRKSAKYAAAGLERYWIIDPEGPEIIVYEQSNDVFVEQGRYRPGTNVDLDLGPATLSFDPADLLG